MNCGFHSSHSATGMFALTKHRGVGLARAPMAFKRSNRTVRRQPKALYPEVRALSTEMSLGRKRTWQQHQCENRYDRLRPVSVVHCTPCPFRWSLAGVSPQVLFRTWFCNSFLPSCRLLVFSTVPSLLLRSYSQMPSCSCLFLQVLFLGLHFSHLNLFFP